MSDVIKAEVFLGNSYGEDIAMNKYLHASVMSSTWSHKEGKSNKTV